MFPTKWYNGFIIQNTVLLNTINMAFRADWGKYLNVLYVTLSKPGAVSFVLEFIAVVNLFCHANIVIYI